MKKGDVIAFSSKGILSWIVKKVTKSEISHVGIMISSEIMIESGALGVKITTIQEVLKRDTKKLVLCKLSDEARSKMDVKKFDEFTDINLNKGYDVVQCLKLGLDRFFPFLKNTENFSRLFCSELVGGYFEYSGVLSNINVSELTPKDVFELPIYKAKKILN